MKYLKNKDLMLFVIDCYAFRYDYGKGKIVLRIKCSENNTTFEDIQTFFNEVSDFEYYEDEILKTVYTQYGADLDIHYLKPSNATEVDNIVSQGEGFYDIEVLRDPSLDAAIRSLQREVDELLNQKQQLENELIDTQIALVNLYEKAMEVK